MITLQAAQRRLISSVTCKQKTEMTSLASALGRVAAADVESSLAIPPTDNSAMDGFAVNSIDARAVSGELKISQRIPAGLDPLPLRSGTAARIFTGGVMPAGAAAVVIQENCEFDTESVRLLKLPTSGDNVRPQGQDITKGAVVVRGGQRLTAVDLSLLASIGHVEVQLYQRLKVALFSTGDELVEPGQALGPGQIYNSNRILLSTLCAQLGYEITDCGIIEDTLPATKQALESAAKTADVILSSGGVSVGEEDHVKPAVEALGELNMWKVQMKPGKPVAFGNVAGVPFLGLPGNPVSSFVVFQLLGVPLLQVSQGQQVSLPQAYTVTSGFDMNTTSREEYIRVRLERGDSGYLTAQRFTNLSSGVMSSLAWADGLVRQPIDSAIKQGQSVDFLPLKQGMLL